MERPILRSELRSASPTPIPPSDDEALQRLRNLSSLQYATQDIPMPDVAPATNPGDEEEELAFNLFAPTAASNNAKHSATEPASQIQKIRLRWPSLDIADAGFVQPVRDRSYYFSEPLDSKAKADFQSSALSGAQILSLCQIPWPGSSYSWKVLHIPSSDCPRSLRSKLAQHAPPGFSKLGQLQQPVKRRRLGKKARITVRQKLQSEKMKREEAMKSKELKEAEEREKRTRRNREKKVKRKAKEKAKKAEGGADADADAEGSTSGRD